MNETMEWLQNNWIDLARLAVQCAILAGLVRYGRKLLGALRASQEQMGALLKLSVSDSVREATPGHSAREAEPVPDFRRPAMGISHAEPEPELEPVFAGGHSLGGSNGEREQSLGGRVIGASAPVFSDEARRRESPSLTPWVSAPESEPERLSAASASQPAPQPAASSNGVSSWLRAPIQPAPQRNAGSPLRRVVRWLKTPAGR